MQFADIVEQISINIVVNKFHLQNSTFSNASASETERTKDLFA